MGALPYKYQNICHDDGMLSILSNGDFISISMSENGDIEVASEKGYSDVNKISEVLNRISNSDRGVYYTDGLYRIDMGDKILVYKLFDDDSKYVLAGYIVGKDNTTRIKLMDAVQRRILRALK